VKSLYCAANKLRGTFDQCSPAVKNTLFRAYCMPTDACQLWSKYTQTSMKRLHAAYNNAYHKKKSKKCWESVCSSQGWTCTNTSCVMRYCMVIHFLCSCEWWCSCGEEKVLCLSQCWSCANTVSV